MQGPPGRPTLPVCRDESRFCAGDRSGGICLLETLLGAVVAIVALILFIDGLNARRARTVLRGAPVTDGLSAVLGSLPLLAVVLERKATLALVGVYLVVPCLLGVVVDALPFE